MEETTLLFRHLPPELSLEERKDLLHYLGASQVRVMGKSGSMKNTAFATFSSKAQAEKVLSEMHQLDVLGSKLVVEFAKDTSRKKPSVVDAEGAANANSKSSDKVSSVNKQVEPKEVRFDTTFKTWGLHHPRRPDLKYLYPPPTPSILTNIMHALAAVPKFYVQVLHLMNKMDLPAPFGLVTPMPPIQPDIGGINLPDDVDQREMDISSETESELESDEEGKDARSKVQRASKRSMKARALLTKKPKLSHLQDEPVVPQPPVPALPVSEVFEQVTEASAAPKRIAMRIQSSVLSHTKPPQTQFPQSASLYNVPSSSLWQPQQQVSQTSSSMQVSMSVSYQQQLYKQQQEQVPSAFPPLPTTSPQIPAKHPAPPLPPPPPPDLESGQEQSPQVGGNSLRNVAADFFYPHQEEDNDKEDAHIEKASEVPNSVCVGGFGKIEPVVKETAAEDDVQEEKEWSKSKFISSSELQKSRLSSSERKELSVFRRYSEGEVSCRLYIKNLSRQTSEEDLHWIYGRYVDWDSETDKNIFDIRLMKEGRMKGQAFVTLPSEKVAATALKDTNGFVLKEKPMVVHFARSAKAQEDSTAIKS